MNQDPFAPKYGVGNHQQNTGQPLQYAGMPVGQPKKSFNILIIPLVLAVVFLLSAIGFGIWAYMGMQDYKLNVQPKIDQAVAIAEEKTKTAKDAEFVEKEKNPLRTYKAARTAGSLVVMYPKTWSAYVEESEKGTDFVNGYFHPSYVPAPDSETDFALRVEVVSQSYDQVMRQFEGKVKSGKLRVAAYRPPKMPEGTVGARVDGEINTGQQDSMVVFPLRDKTIKISTESAQFLGDFNNIILANFVFEP